MKAFKELDYASKIPVVVVSNSVSDEHINTMLEMGVKRYILKAEYRLDELIKIFKNIVEDKIK